MIRSLTVLSICLILNTGVQAQNRQERIQNRYEIRSGKRMIDRDRNETEAFEQLALQIQSLMARGQWRDAQTLLDEAHVYMQREIDQGWDKYQQAGREVIRSQREVRSEQREMARNRADLIFTKEDRRDDRRDIRQDRRDLRDDRRDRRDDQRDQHAIRQRTAEKTFLLEQLDQFARQPRRNQEEINRVLRDFLEIMEADMRANQRELREDRRERNEDRRERRDDRRERREIWRGGL